MKTLKKDSNYRCSSDSAMVRKHFLLFIACLLLIACLAVQIFHPSHAQNTMSVLQNQYIANHLNGFIMEFVKRTEYENAVSKDVHDGLILIDFRKLKTPDFLMDGFGKEEWSGSWYCEEYLESDGYANIQGYYDFLRPVDVSNGRFLIEIQVCKDYEMAQALFLLNAAGRTSMAILPWSVCDKKYGTFCVSSKEKDFLFFFYKNVAVTIVAAPDARIADQAAEWVSDVLKNFPRSPMNAPFILRDAESMPFTQNPYLVSYLNDWDTIGQSSFFSTFNGFIARTGYEKAVSEEVKDGLILIDFRNTKTPEFMKKEINKEPWERPWSYDEFIERELYTGVRGYYEFQRTADEPSGGFSVQIRVCKDYEMAQALFLLSLQGSAPFIPWSLCKKKYGTFCVNSTSQPERSVSFFYKNVTVTVEGSGNVDQAAEWVFDVLKNFPRSPMNAPFVLRDAESMPFAQNPYLVSHFNSLHPASRDALSSMLEEFVTRTGYEKAVREEARDGLVLVDFRSTGTPEFMKKEAGEEGWARPWSYREYLEKGSYDGIQGYYVFRRTADDSNGGFSVVIRVCKNYEIAQALFLMYARTSRMFIPWSLCEKKYGTFCVGSNTRPEGSIFFLYKNVTVTVEGSGNVDQAAEWVSDVLKNFPRSPMNAPFVLRDAESMPFTQNPYLVSHLNASSSTFSSKLEEFRTRIGYEKAVSEEMRDGLILIDFRNVKTPEFMKKNTDREGWARPWSYNEYLEQSIYTGIQGYYEFERRADESNGGFSVVVRVCKDYEMAQALFLVSERTATMRVPWSLCEKRYGTLCVGSTPQPGGSIFFLYRNVTVTIKGPQNEPSVDQAAEWVFDVLKNFPRSPMNAPFVLHNAESMSITQNTYLVNYLNIWPPLSHEAFSSTLEEFVTRTGYEKAVREETRDGLVLIDFRNIKTPEFMKKELGKEGWEDSWDCEEYFEKEFYKGLRGYYVFRRRADISHGGFSVEIQVCKDYEMAQALFLLELILGTSAPFIPWSLCKEKYGTFCVGSAFQPEGSVFFFYKNVTVTIRGSDNVDQAAEWVSDALKNFPRSPMNAPFVLCGR